MYPSVWQILIVLVLVLLLFGRGKISGLMGELAHGIKSFKKGMTEEPEIAEKQTDSLKSESAAAPDEVLVEKDEAAKG
jgi:sec-independent protein translocase protein TatA